MKKITDLPPEILEMIFNLLPPYKDLQNCGLVCSEWTKLVKGIFARKTMAFEEALFQNKLSWKRLPSTGDAEIPLCRKKPAVAFCKHKFFVFGGMDTSVLWWQTNDLWALDLATRAWERLDAAGKCPRGRMAATMVYHERRLILFGGLGIRESDELNIYDLREKCWSKIKKTCSLWPPCIYEHSASVQGRQMVVFGGNQCRLYPYHERRVDPTNVWTLDLDKFFWRIQATSANKPSHRKRHYHVRINDENMLIIGGSWNKDFWLLTTTSPVWTWRKINQNYCGDVIFETNANPYCAFNGKLIVLDRFIPGPNPVRREIQQFSIYKTNFLICDLSKVLDDEESVAKWLEPRQVRNPDETYPPRTIIRNILVPVYSPCSLIAGSGEVFCIWSNHLYVTEM